ncbi:MAG: transglycosylase SLT domain-containing protein [Aminipila sp.]
MNNSDEIRQRRKLRREWQKEHRQSLTMLIFLLIIALCFEGGVIYKQAKKIDILYDIKIQLEQQIYTYEYGPDLDNAVINDNKSMDEINAEDTNNTVSLRDTLIEHYSEFLGKDISQFAYDYSELQGVDPKATFAVIEAESGFNPNLISKNGDYGLMQINKSNHQWLSKALGVTDFLDPKQNIRAGVYMLRCIQNNNYDNLHQVLMVYNQGSRGAIRDWNKGIYSSNYSRNVINKMIRH